MIRGMVCRNRKAFAARCLIVWLAGFGGRPARVAVGATIDSVVNQSTPEAKVRSDGAGANSDRSPTPVSFDLRERYQIVVRGAVAGLEGLNLLIDTGSVPSMVDRRVAKKLGLDVQQFGIVAFGQKSRALTTVLPSILLGPLRADAVTAGIGDLSFLHGVDAIIGLDVLAQSSFSIDYNVKQVTFGPLAAHERTIPLEFTPPFLTVQLALAGRPVRLLVDTGIRRLVLFERRVRDRIPHLTVRGELVMYHISGTAHLRRVLLPRLDAGGIAIEHLEAFLSDASVEGYPAGIDGVLGVRALAPKRAEFDFERNRFGFQ